MEKQSLRTDDFEYQLPPRFIAQTPVEPRDSSRMMVLSRGSTKIAHRRFHHIEDYLKRGDALVLNDTRVRPARLRGKKETGGNVEILLLRRLAERTWVVMVGGRGMRPGVKVELSGGKVFGTILREDGNNRVIRFTRSILPMLREMGEIAVPPYIRERLLDDERYQTVYGEKEGSAAAPTAGLHFTRNLLEKLRYKGVKIVTVTLHVGLDTFLPVRVKRINDHPIHSEWCCVNDKAVSTIKAVRRGGGRVVAVGTTTARVLETAARADHGEKIAPVYGETDVFITPGYRFQLVDVLITNFHLPRSTLLMMVAAFVGPSGHKQILEAYKVAIKSGYRFYSFGDAMLIL